MKPQLNYEQSLNGWITLSAMINNQRATRRYCGFSLKEAKKRFKKELK